DLCLDLGEGATSLSALPMLQMALTLAGAGVPVEPQPLTRFDPSTGGQVFVGQAQVEPVEEAVEEEPAVPSAALTAPTTSIGAKAKSRPAPPKPTPAKSTGPKAAKAAKAAAAKARGSGRSSGSRSGAAKSTGS